MGVAAILVQLPKQSNSPVISDKKMFRCGGPMSGLGLKVTGQLDIWYLHKTIVSLGKTFLTGIMLSAKTVIEKVPFKIFLL